MFRRALTLRALQRTTLRYAAAAKPATPQWTGLVVEAIMDVEDWQGNQDYAGHGQGERDLETPLLLRAFRQFDADKNMFLDREELTLMLRSYGLDSSQIAVDRAFSELDANNDGKISLVEFCTGETGVGLKQAILAKAADES